VAASPTSTDACKQVGLILSSGHAHMGLTLSMITSAHASSALYGPTKGANFKAASLYMAANARFDARPEENPYSSCDNDIQDGRRQTPHR
jgi:hypothetical protein